MCCSVSSIQNWFFNPIEFQKEKCRLLAFSAIALFVIGLAALSFVYGENVYFAGYNKIFAYVAWGMTGGAILSTVIAYIAKGILSSTGFNLGVRRVHTQTRVEERSQLAEEERSRIENLGKMEELTRQMFIKWNKDLYYKLFPTKGTLSKYPDDLISSKGFNHEEALQRYFGSGDQVVRGYQEHGGKQCPFIGLHLAIHQADGSKTSAILFIALNMEPIKWNVYGSPGISENMISEIESFDTDSELFVKWVEDILKKVPRRLLTHKPLDGSETNLFAHYLIDKTFSKDSAFIEKKDAPVVTLWN